MFLTDMIMYSSQLFEDEKLEENMRKIDGEKDCVYVK